MVSQLNNMIRMDIFTENGYRVYVLDEQSGSIYQYDYRRVGHFLINGYGSFKDGDKVLKFKDLGVYK